MNFLQKSNNILFVFFILFLFFFHNIKAQYNELGTPFVQNIDIKSFGYKNKNHAIIQNKAGVYYIANDNGIIQFDGKDWKLIDIQEKLFLTLKNDSIFAASYNSFGIIRKNEENKPEYYSLLKSSDPLLGEINSIITHNNKIFICSKDKLFLWNGSILETIDSIFIPSLFKVNKILYLHSPQKGLMVYEKNKFKAIPNGSFFINKNIVAILPFQDKLLIKLENNDPFLLYDSGNIIPFLTEADNFLKENIFTTAINYNNENYALGTKKGGIALIDGKGKLITYINQHNKLAENNVLKFHIDHTKNLWALHPNKLSRISTSAASTYFDNDAEYMGDINALIRHEENIYLGTSLGIFYLKKDQNYSCTLHEKFSPILGIESECEKFLEINNHIFALTKTGIYNLNKNNASLSLILSNVHYFYSIRKDLIFITTNKGFGILKFNGLTWQQTNNYEFPHRIKKLVETEDNIIWINTINKGIYRISTSILSEKKINFEKYIITNGLPADYSWNNISNTSNGIIFTCSAGFWQYSNDNAKFIENTLIPIASNEYSWIYPIVEDNSKNLWINSFSEKSASNKLLFCKNEGFNKPYKLTTLTFNQQKNFNPTVIYPEKSGIIWLAGNKGIIRYDSKVKRMLNNVFYTLIQNIKIDNDSTIYYNDGYLTLQEKTSTFSHSNNTLRFEFSATDYENENNLFFQYKLIGFNNSWSEWNRNNFKEYTHLPKGEYIFIVRSKNLYEEISEETEFKFKLLPPFYCTWWAYVIYFILSIIIVMLISKLRINYLISQKLKLDTIIKKRTKDIVIQKKKTDDLLANMLPEETAKELIDTGKVSTKKFKIVTVLFSDIQGFTKITDELNPEILIDELDKFFFKFDSVVEKYNIEKIKTIGDAYMCAGGIPTKNRTNPIEVVLAAIEMRQYMRTIQNDGRKKNIWGLRIGIDTGPIIAGVVGRKKLSYDIWGSTVNTASRMESSGEVDKINITGNTFMLINEFFICQYRGKMPIKNKGEIDMYFVEGIRPKLSADLKGVEPNYDLITQLQLLRLSDLEELVLNKLEEGLPKDLYYHNLKHTVDVYTQVELIGKSENVTEEELLILRTAALFHDIGHTVDFDTHEEVGVKLAREILPDFQYTNDHINIVAELIMATKMPPNPTNLLEKIICDADLDYLGRVDFIPVSKNLFRELYERNKISSETEWNKLQIKFIQSHQYFTKTARKLRDVNKNKQLENIRKLVDDN